MESLKIPIKTITYLFAGGAEPGDLELRPTAIKGALRYWLRAGLGGVYGDQDEGISKVRQIEGKIFGSAEDEGGASDVIIRLENVKLKNNDEEYDRDTMAEKKFYGTNYFYWSMHNKPYASPGSQFDLLLSERPHSGNTNSSLKMATAALWLLVHLGGIGSRSRRTAGCLVVRSPITHFDLNFQLPPKGILPDLSKGISTARMILNPDSSTCSFKDLTEFDILHPDVCHIYYLGSWDSAASAVENIGIRYKEARTTWSGTEKASFGLPFQGVNLSHKTRINRRASPIWLTVNQAGDHYIGLATLFKSRFLPEGARLRYRGKNIDLPSNYDLVTHWIEEKFPKAREVKYD